MFIHLDREGTIDKFRAAVGEVLDRHAPRGLFILAGDGNGFEPRTLDPLLREIPVPIFGGVFPAIIHGRELLERGTLVAGLSAAPDVRVMPGLSSDVPNFDDQIDEVCSGAGGFQTMVVLVDGMGTRVNTLLASLFNVFGLECNYLGGGAGSLELKRKPCLLTSQGLLEDSALLVMLSAACGVGVSHGMQSVSGPYRITEARGNVIHSLDWKPAHVCFREAVQALTEDVSDGETFPVSKSFCIAVNRLGAEKMVRDPTHADRQGTLYFTPEIVEGEFVDIVRATPESTIAAAREALKLAQGSYIGERPYKTIVTFDCSGRQKFLGQRFAEEIEAVNDGVSPVIGALTFGGEIANSGRDYLDYYNRTCIVAVMEE